MSADFRVYDISGLTTAFCALAAMGYDQPPRFGAMLAVSVLFWAAGMSGATATVNEAVPERAMLIDRVLTTHLSVLPVYVMLYSARSDRSVVYRAAAGGAVAAIAIVVYALTQRGDSAVGSVKYAARGLVVVLVAMVVLLFAAPAAGAFGGHGRRGGRPVAAADGGAPELLLSMLAIEALYAGVFAYVEPVGANTLETIASAIGREAEVAPPKSASCAPMCVGDGDAASLSQANACYAHNARLAQLHHDVATNVRNGLPEMSGLTNQERACVRAHPVGSTCTFCQGEGCMRSPGVPGAICTETAKAHGALLATVNAESKRHVKAGYGVLSFEEQLAQARAH